MKSALVIIASDKTKIYDHKKANRVFTTLKSKKYSLQDLILILLVARDIPIHGRTLIMKELFLLYKRLLSNKTQDPKFVKYRLGPYSFHLVEIIKIMNSDGLVEVKGRKNSNSESFKLTKKGKNDATKIFKKLPASIKKDIIKKRKGWDQLGTNGILNYVYSHYPSYKEKSILKNRYKDIIWGE